MSYNILSIDGGGVRGVVAARLLQRLENECPGLMSKFDLYAGTSTGALASLSFAAGLSVDDVFDLYRARVKEIFKQSFWRKLNFNIFISKYDNKGLSKAIRNVFGETRLSDLPRKVVIPTFDLDGFTSEHRVYKPTFYTNLLGSISCNELVADIAIASSSAPTYFPSFNGYIDGGIAANSPSVSAIAQALNKDTHPIPKLTDINLLSIGTGKIDYYVKGKRLDWGILQWGPKMVDMFFYADLFVADYQARQFLESRYCRINPLLDNCYDLDDVKSVDKLIDNVDRFDLTESIEWVKQKLLKESMPSKL
jgi:patatin-like phospholipase/acyl hydrolase